MTPKCLSLIIRHKLGFELSASKIKANPFSTRFENGSAWIDNHIVPIEEARIPVNDWGITHSDICYDVVPVRNGSFFRSPLYLSRFEASMA